MARYEVTAILAEESTQNPAAGLIEAAGGSILSEESLGKRRFAYPINKLTNGVYERIRFEAEPGVIPTLDEKLRHESSVIRYLIVNQPHEVKAPVAEVDEAAIEALGDVKEMTRQAEKEATQAKKETAPAEESAEETLAEEPVVEEPVEEPIVEPATDTTTSTNENQVDESTRQAALDEKLKNILGN